MHRPHRHRFPCSLPAPLPPTLPQQLPEMPPGLALCSPGMVGGRGPRPGTQGLEAPLTQIWALRGWPASPLPFPASSPTLNFLGCSPGNLRAEFLLGYTHFKTRLLKSRPVVVGEEGLSSCPSASAQPSQKPEMDQGVHALHTYVCRGSKKGVGSGGQGLPWRTLGCGVSHALPLPGRSSCWTPDCQARS